MPLKALSGFWNKIKGKEGNTDLGGNCNMSIPDRLKLDGALYAQFKPDVIALQECWKSDNRDMFIKSLPPGYHITFNPNLGSVNPAMMNDGLVFATRGEPFFKDYIVFTDHMGNEDMAQKGAIFIGLDNYQGTSPGHPDPPLLLVTSHLNAGVDDDFITVQDKQCQQIAAKIKDIQAKVPRLKDAPIVIMGDFNQPFSLMEDDDKQVLMVDRFAQMIEAFRNAGIMVTEEQRISQLAARYNVKKIARIYQLKNAGLMLDVATGARSQLDKPKLLGVFKNQRSEWMYFPDATDGDGFQVLDHVFGYRVRFSNWRTLRKETLADKGAALPIDKDKALSDHSAQIFDVVAY